MDMSNNTLSEHLTDELFKKYTNFTGGDIKALLKRHIGPIFIIGVDGRAVIINVKKGLVRIFVDYAGKDVVLRSHATLFDKPIDKEVAYRIIIALATLEQVIENKENEHV